MGLGWGGGRGLYPLFRRLLGVRITILHCKFFIKLILLNILKVVSSRNLLGPSRHLRDGAIRPIWGLLGGMPHHLKCLALVISQSGNSSEHFKSGFKF